MRMNAKAQLLAGQGRTLPLDLNSLLKGWQPGPQYASGTDLTKGVTINPAPVIDSFVEGVVVARSDLGQRQ